MAYGVFWGYEVGLKIHINLVISFGSTDFMDIGEDIAK